MRSMRIALDILGVAVALLVVIAGIAFVIYLLTMPVDAWPRVTFIMTVIISGVVYGIRQLGRS